MIKTLLGNRIIIKQENKRKSSVLIIDEDLSFNQGEVVKISEKINDIKVGDRLLFKELSGEQVEFDEQKFLVLNYEDIIAIL